MAGAGPALRGTGRAVKKSVRYYNIVFVFFDREPGQRPAGRPFKHFTAGIESAAVAGADKSLGRRVNRTAKMGAGQSKGVNIPAVIDHGDFFLAIKQRPAAGNILLGHPQYGFFPLYARDQIFSQYRQGNSRQD